MYSDRMMQITIDLHSMDVNTTYTEGCVSGVEGLADLQSSEDSYVPQAKHNDEDATEKDFEV